MRWGKSILSNLFQTVGILVDRSCSKWYWSHCQNT